MLALEPAFDDAAQAVGGRFDAGCVNRGKAEQAPRATAPGVGVMQRERPQHHAGVEHLLRESDVVQRLVEEVGRVQGGEAASGAHQAAEA